jgi:hypothetical protein
MTRVAVGRDIESDALLGFVTGYKGTSSTAPTATTFTTDGVNIPVNSVTGRIVATGAVFGIVQSNTSAANSVLTIDRWYAVDALPANVNAAAAGTPAAGVWQLLPGNCPAAYMGLTATATTAVDGDTVLTGELNAAGAAGLNRQLATYAHTAAGTTTTLVKTFTAAAADSLPVTIAQVAILQGVVLAASRLVFRTVLNATMAFSLIGDQGQVTHTTTL